MALGKQTISIRFAGGVDTKTDAKQVPATKLLRLENAVFTKATSLVKRQGYDALPRETTDGAEYPDILAVGVRNHEMVGFSDDAAWSYMESLRQWRRIGTAFSFVPSERTVAKTGTVQTAGDHATAGGVSVYAWEDSRGGIWYAVADAETGHIAVRARQLSATGERPRCVRAGSMLHVYWAEPSVPRVFRAVVNPGDLDAIPEALPFLSDVTSECLYDAENTWLFDNSPVIAWVTATGYRVGYVTPAGVLGTISTGYPNPVTVTVTSPLRIAVAFNQRQDVLAPLGIMYATSNTIVCRAHSVFLSLAPATGAVTISSYSGTVTGLTGAWQRDEVAPDVYRLWVAWGIDNGGDVRDRVVFTGSFASDGTDGETVLSQLGSDLASRAFRAGPRVFVHVVHDVTYFSAYFAMCISADPMVLASRVLPGVAGNVPDGGHLPSVVYDESSADTVRWIAGYRAQLSSADGDQFAETGLQLVSYDVASPQSHRSAQLGQGLYVSGAMPLLYDSAVIAEAGINYAPDGPIPAVVGSGGSIAAGTTSYQIVYEAILANGEIMLGPPSIAIRVEIENNDSQVTLTIPTYRHTAWPNVRIGVFRSELGDANAQPARYRVTSIDPGDTTGANRYLLNSRTVNTVTFVDAISDEELLTREPLYTNGGILANDPIPGAGVLARGKSRLFTSDPQDPDLVRFSQEIRDGYAAEFSPDLSVKVDSYGGRVSALAVLDDSVVVFKEAAIYFFAGPGPLANPAVGGGFSQAALITADVGCAAPRSIAYTPVGIVFQSPKGIYLLDRGRQVRYLGTGVEAYRDRDVVAATLIENRTQIRFLLGEGDVSLLYDYYFDQWSTFTNHIGRDAALVAGTYNYVREDGTIYREVDAFTDNGQPVRTKIETAEIRLQETLQGMQMVWWVLVLGSYLSPHTLQVRFATDYERRWSSAFEYDPSETRTATPWGSGAWGAGPWGGSIEERYQFQVHIGERCESIRLLFEDRPDPDSPGASFELSELLVIGGVRKPDNRPLGEGRTH